MKIKISVSNTQKLMRGLQETGDYYNFTNIRYGQAPLGQLRWAAPQAPNNTQNDSVSVVDGTEQGGNCPQTFPCWFQIQTAFTKSFLAGEEFDFNSTYAEVYADDVCSQPTPESERLPSETEDCLFLDVFVPRTVFDRANGTSANASVLVYIFGGGYSGGSKDSFGYFEGSPAGLIDSSRVTNPDGVIYVAINYRVSMRLEIPLPTLLFSRRVTKTSTSLGHSVGCSAPITIPKVD
jgi:carboxylesterase type B